jgi:hypothetical protein
MVDPKSRSEKRVERAKKSPGANKLHILTIISDTSLFEIILVAGLWAEHKKLIAIGSTFRETTVYQNTR